jgi:hypothetical protein
MVEDTIEDSVGALIKPHNLVGIHQDLILSWYGKPYRITRVGNDANGLIVNWHYDKFKLTLSRVKSIDPVYHKPITAYFVTKVHVKKKVEESNVKRKIRRRYKHH